MDRGLGQIELVSEGPYLPELELNCDRCILTTGKNDEANVPLVEYVGIRRIEDAEQRFRVIGQGNQYSRIETRWSIVPVEGGANRLSTAARRTRMVPGIQRDSGD